MALAYCPRLLRYTKKHIININCLAVRRTSSTTPPLHRPSLHSTIKSNTTIVNIDDTIDDIKLHLLDNMIGNLDEERISNDRRLQKLLVDPFWGYLWPGSYALHKHVQQHGDSTIKGRNVLDFASGCGLSAITASRLGPVEVLANDIDDFAIAAVEVNSALNGVEPGRIGLTAENLCANGTVVKELFKDPSLPLTILCGDVFYDTDFAAVVMEWLAKQDGAEIYVGDPGRHALPRSGELEEVAEYDLPPLLRDTNNGMTSVKCFRYRSV